MLQALLRTHHTIMVEATSTEQWRQRKCRSRRTHPTDLPDVARGECDMSSCPPQTGDDAWHAICETKHNGNRSALTAPFWRNGPTVLFSLSFSLSPIRPFILSRRH